MKFPAKVFASLAVVTTCVAVDLVVLQIKSANFEAVNDEKCTTRGGY